MKIIGYMLCFYDTNVNYWRPTLNPEPWTFSKTVGEQMLLQQQIRNPEIKFKLAEVKIK